ncbi:MAG TPA: ribonuclease III [Candidatus Kapabacteria bacterium]|nr:ribonuclease III [Candidatus Kapabacteria bacterium]
MIRQLVNKLFGRAQSRGSSVESIFSPYPDRRQFINHGLVTPRAMALLEEVVGYRIANVAYFEQALVHRSYLQVAEQDSVVSNERLEFLGDSILNMLIGEFLFHRYTDIQEGELTKLRSRLVNRKALTICARMVRLEEIVLLNSSAEQSLEQGNDSLLADAFEAIIAAIYLDTNGDLRLVKEFLARTLLTPETCEKVLFIDENFKSILLEHMQAQGLGAPRYMVVKEEGPDHERVFTVQVLVGGEVRGEGRGRSKKEAEQHAAAEAVEKLNIDMPAI